jgi:predicted O-methyltransferase YrrM
MPSFSRRIRNRLKHGLHTMFALGQRAGWDILPRHFYSSIPDLRRLQQTDYWRQPSSMIGVAGTEIDSQLQFLRQCCQPVLREHVRNLAIHRHACQQNGEVGYGLVEADFLFCFVATKRPKRIIQVGCGVSTAVILMAAKQAEYQPELVCIEPFPTRFLRNAAADRRITLIAERAEQVDLGTLTNLESGDFFFVDSTHAVKPGGEVNRIILEVLPRLRPDCFVHFHDINFPYDYSTGVLAELFFPAENTLLHAFLVNNVRCSLAVSLSMLHYACPQELQSALPNYQPAAMQNGLHAATDGGGHFPSATYLLTEAPRFR